MSSGVSILAMKTSILFNISLFAFFCSLLKMKPHSELSKCWSILSRFTFSEIFLVSVLLRFKKTLYYKSNHVFAF